MNQTTIHKDIIPVAAFGTPITRLFGWLRRPMGASRSPGWFVKVLNDVIQGLEGVEAYLDDVVEYDSTPAQHVASLRALFSRLRARTTCNCPRLDRSSIPPTLIFCATPSKPQVFSPTRAR